MKTTLRVGLAAVLLVSTIAFAQTQQAPSSTGSENSDIMQNNQPANNMPNKASDENSPSATPQSISQSCSKQAADKKLSGDDKTTFIKQCKQGKTTRSGN